MIFVGDENLDKNINEHIILDNLHHHFIIDQIHELFLEKLHEQYGWMKIFDGNIFDIYDKMDINIYTCHEITLIYNLWK